MRFTISGFGGASKEGQETPAAREAEPVSAAPRKSVVQVCFPEAGRSLAYYNDRFNLKAGDRVYVSGKLEGVLGIVTSVNYNFRIRLSEYQKVIFQVNTRVHGRFYMSASHFITFDPATLPAAQVTSWFRAPVGGGEEFASGNDDFSFSLEHLEESHQCHCGAGTRLLHGEPRPLSLSGWDKWVCSRGRDKSIRR